MASRMFQSIILQMKDAVDRTIGIITASGAVVACTDLKRIGEMREDAAAELSYVGDMIRFGGYTYRPVADRSTRFEYAVFVHGEDENARSICSMAAIAISNIKTLYDEKHDKATFIKNIILDNILPGDIYIKSQSCTLRETPPAQYSWFVRKNMQMSLLWTSFRVCSRISSAILSCTSMKTTSFSSRKSSRLPMTRS